MKNDILENSISNIDDDLIEMTAQKLTRARPRKALSIVKFAGRFAGITAAAAAVCIAVQLGIRQYNDRLIQSGSFSSSDSANSGAVDSVIIPPSSDDTTSSSSSSNDTSQTPSSSSGTLESSENKKIEELIRLNLSDHRYPHVACDVPEGMYVSFEFGKDIHIPIPSDGPGFTRAYDISYLKGHNFLVIAYDAGKPNSISFLRTEDKGVSWQSSELEAEYPWGFYSLAFLNSRDGIFLLQDRDVVTNQSRGDNIIYTTESYGETWKQAGYLSGDYSIINGIKVAEDHYWITGDKTDIAGGTFYPVLLKSDDGVNWKETQISLDTTKYKNGYCTHVYFSGEIGAAEVVGRNASNDNVIMWYSSEDGGETWSFYKIDRIT